MAAVDLGRYAGGSRCTGQEIPVSERPSRVPAVPALLMVCGYFALQALMIVLHEFAHSTTAWALGYTPTPLTVVWGNLVTMQGWDEGVPYDALFAGRGHVAEAAIGGAPLAMHVLFVVALTIWLRSAGAITRPVVFFSGYWFLVLNLAELVAYLWMRPFIATGDTGRFNQGMDLSPWILFVCGSVFLAGALSIFHGHIVPKVASAVRGRRLACAAILVATGFVLFLWASGLRFLVIYPDPLWRVGLIGSALFVAWLIVELPRVSPKRNSTHPAPE
ncbi:MAG: hypothetical protein ACRYFW_00410 [Janthinobacterium lividum]